MPQSSVPVSVESNADTPSCDCLAHVYGNAAEHGERTRHYPSDMTDVEWAQVRAVMPVPGWLEGRGGEPESYCHRQMIDAIRFLMDNGIKWRAMPVDFPAWHRVYVLFRRRRDKGLVKEFHDGLRGKTRAAAGRDPEPTAGIIDSQSVKAAASVPAASRGFDGGKKINGRERRIVVDTTGLLLTVMVTAANVTDREAAQVLLARLTRRFFLLRLVWADGGHTGPLLDFAVKALRLAPSPPQPETTPRTSHPSNNRPTPAHPSPVNSSTSSPRASPRPRNTHPRRHLPGPAPPPGHKGAIPSQPTRNRLRRPLRPHPQRLVSGYGFIHPTACRGRAA